MFQPNEVDEIRRVARSIPPDIPSRSVLERLAQVAVEPGWTVEVLCLEIDELAACGKLAREKRDDDRTLNLQQANLLNGLMRLLGEEGIRGRIKRASALHKISKLRGAS